MRELLAAIAISIVTLKAPDPSLATKAVQVTRDGVIEAQIWPRATPLITDKTGEERTNFGHIQQGEVLGSIRLHKSWSDYRGQRVPPGTYTLHYAIQPRLKDHAGTTRYRDFAILMPYQSTHPFVMAIVPPNDAKAGETVIRIDSGGVVLGLVYQGMGELGL